MSSNLTRKKITVRGKHGTYQRSVMVRGMEAAKKVGRTIFAHKGKIVAGAALTGAAVMGYKNRNYILAGVREVRRAHTADGEYNERVRAHGWPEDARTNFVRAGRAFFHFHDGFTGEKRRAARTRSTR